MELITESLQTPVAEPADVIVFGSGSAGIGAALAAARNGVRVMLVEPASYAGGTLVSGLPILGCHNGTREVVKGIHHEICDRLASMNAIEGSPEQQSYLPVDIESLKVLLLRMLQESKVELRLHTLFARAIVNDGKIQAAVVEGKGGRRALRAKVFIDCTGDADVAASSGVPVEKGRTSDGGMQPMSMIFAVANVDEQRFNAWGGYNKVVELYRKLSAEQNYRNPRRTDLSTFWRSPNRPGEISMNVTRILQRDGSDAKALSAADIEGREQCWEFLEKFLKPHVPGFENGYIAWSSAKIGVRETRRIVGEYVLNEEDLHSFRKFPDTVVCGSYPIDIHSPSGDGTRLEHTPSTNQYWTVPYRSLVPLNVENLLVAGRCLSATHEALSAVRVMANTMAMGEAAGVAAALAVQSGCAAKHVNIETLQRKLVAQNAFLGDDINAKFKREL